MVSDLRGMVSDFVLGSYALASKPKTKPAPTLLDPTLLSHSSMTPHSSVERPGLEGGNELSLVDDAVLKGEQAEEEVMVRG